MIGKRVVLSALVVMLASGLCTGVEPRLVTLPPKQRPVADVLRALELQTGNRIVDRRSTPATDSIDISLKDQTFWQAVELIAVKLDARISTYGDDSIRLSDGPARPTPVVNASVCRVELKSLAVQHDFPTDRRTCVADIEIVWEPRLDPLYLTVDNVMGSFAADASGKALTFGPTNGVAQPVAQRRSQIVELRFPAPERSSASMAVLSGQIKLLGPDRMIAARFKDLQQGKQDALVKEDGVSVKLTEVAAGKDKAGKERQNWAFDLAIENPPDTPTFESFQSWLDNNRIHLERTVNGKTEIWPHRPDDWSGDWMGRKANLKYTFTGAAGKGSPSEWTLVYRTPGPIVVTTIPFTFRDVPLP